MSSISKGGFRADFVHELQRRHICPLCNLALCQPYQTECGHLFCKECLEPVLSVFYAKCPVDNEDISWDGTFPDNACRREILNLLVYCKHKQSGCGWVGELKVLEAHLSTCNYRNIQCTQCGRWVSLMNYDKHQSVECPMRPSLCPHCNHKVPTEQLEAHLRKVCPKYNQHLCPNKCDTNKKYFLSEAHIAIKGGDCPLQVLSCPFVKFGCTYECVRGEMMRHLQDNLLYHSQIQADAISDVHVQVKEAMKSVKEVEEHLERVDLRSNSIESKQQQLDLSVNIIDKKSDSNIERLILRVNSLEEQVNKISMDLKYFRSASPPTSISRQSPRLEHVLTKLTEMDHSVGRCLSFNMEFDLRLQLIERATYDGILLWKIDEFSQRRKEAIEGTTISLYSIPFYTSHQGYKMCARIYLNGDGIGKGTHLSLFFVIMKGNNDALLQWPFRQKVTLSILNQTGKKNIIDQFRPDPQSSSFHRPINREMNIASGCPTLCRLDQLKDGFIKDDCIFIGIVVDTSNLVKPVVP